MTTTALSTTVPSHILGYPHTDTTCETTLALEPYWAGIRDKTETQAALLEAFNRRIQDQIDAGLDVITTGDFGHYDVLFSQAVAFGVQPPRFQGSESLDTFDRQFYFAHGRDRTGQCQDAAAWQMAKWFDTDDHYLVPELEADESFSNTDFSPILQQVADAKAVITQSGQTDTALKVALIGPVSFLYLAVSKHDDKLAHLDALLPVYADLLNQLDQQGVEWVQMDEPILSLDLDGSWQQAFERAYNGLQQTPPKLIVASYFGTLGNNCHTVCNLPVSGIHIDITRLAQLKQYVTQVIDHLPSHKLLSIGIVDGYGACTADHSRVQDILCEANERLNIYPNQSADGRNKQRLWVGTGASRLHLSVDSQIGQAAHTVVQQKLSDVVMCAHIAAGTSEVAHLATSNELSTNEPAINEAVINESTTSTLTVPSVDSATVPA